MRFSVATWLVVFLLLTATGSQIKSKPLSNYDVIQMVSLGLGDKLIIQKIWAATTTAFDTSINGLKALKEAKVSDAVLHDMIDAQVIQDGQASKTDVITSPVGAEVYIDGQKGGVTPFVFLLLKRDWPRTITIKLSGYKRVEKTFVPDGKPIRIGIALEREIELALLSSRGYRSETGDYMIVDGQVQNISDSPLRSIEAVTNWYSEDGSFISSNDTLIQYDPILPGQTSPFKVMTRANPEMHRFTVDFKSFSGGTIDTIDRRQTNR